MDNSSKVFVDAATNASTAHLCSHIKTQGVYKTRIAISPFDFELYDVGGTRSARKKWMHCMGEKPDHMIYVVDLNGYCQNLAEDLEANQMRESLHVFESVINDNSTRDVPVFLLLNKADTFEQRIARNPVSDYFADYCGGVDYFKACRYFADHFARLDRRPPGKLFCYVTNSLDTAEFRNAWRQVQEKMIYITLKY
ncbi:MAG: hypothetical protein Q9170_003856 [Blastenia crenularia]